MSPERKRRSQAFRMHVHRHNGYMGNVGMMNAFCINMLRSESVTPEAKQILHQIQELRWRLEIELKRRVDPPHLLPLEDSKEVS